MREGHGGYWRQACVLVLVLLVGTTVVGCADDGKSAQTLDTQEWRVLSATESNVGEHRSLYYYILVSPGCDREGLESITREIVRRAKREGPFSRVWIQFYDYPELHDIGYAGPPLGFARYGATAAPSTGTQNGDYAKMVYTYALTIPDWDDRPSQHEIDLAVYRLQLAREAESHGRKRSERELVRRTAKHFGVTADEVVAAVTRVDEWVTEPGGRAW